MTSWFLKSIDATKMRVILKDNEVKQYTLFLEFFILPTFIYVQKNDAQNNIKILTDGCFHKINEQDNLDDYHYLPEGYRYGAHVNVNNIIIYKDNFWDYPNVGYKNNNSPFMRQLRPMTIKSYVI